MTEQCFQLVADVELDDPAVIEPLVRRHVPLLELFACQAARLVFENVSRSGIDTPPRTAEHLRAITVANARLTSVSAFTRPP